MARLRWPSLLIAVWANARRAAGLAGFVTLCCRGESAVASGGPGFIAGQCDEGSLGLVGSERQARRRGRSVSQDYSRVGRGISTGVESSFEGIRLKLAGDGRIACRRIGGAGRKGTW